MVVLKSFFISILFCESVGDAGHVGNACAYSVDKRGEGAGLSQGWVNHIEIQ